MKTVTLFLTAVRIMNLNITISAARIHSPTLQAVSFATFIQIYSCRLMEVICALNSAIPCSAMLCCVSAITTTEVTLAAGLEKVQRETLSLLDNVSTMILTSAGQMSTSNTDHGFRIIFWGRWIFAEFTSKDSDFEWRSSVFFYY